MTVKVLLFAQARDLAGSETVEIELSDGATVADLRQTLVEKHPALERIAPSLLIAVNNDYAEDATEVPTGAEVACFPPVSGG